MSRPEFVTLAGVRTRYLDSGTPGTVVVLAHTLDFARAGLCHNAQVWEQVAASLAGSFRVIAFDALGHGRTDQPQDAAGYTLEAQVAHVRELLRALGVARAHIVGHGDSAVTAVRLAFDAPDAVASCTITGSAAAAPAGDADVNLTLAAPLRPLYSRQGQRWILERQSFAPGHAQAGNFLNEAVAIAETPEFAEATQHQSAQHAALRFQSSLMSARSVHFVRFREQGMPVPTLVAWGNQDPISPLAFAHSLFALIAEHQAVQLRVFNRAGNLAFREQPEMFAAALRGFIHGVEAGQ